MKVLEAKYLRTEGQSDFFEVKFDVGTFEMERRVPLFPDNSSILSFQAPHEFYAQAEKHAQSAPEHQNIVKAVFAAMAEQKPVIVPVPEYDPIKDEKKPFTLEEFTATAKKELDQYTATFKDANDYHKQPHTWNEWWKSFHEYMSW